VLERWIDHTLDEVEAPEPVVPVNRTPLERFFRVAIGA